MITLDYFSIEERDKACLQEFAQQAYSTVHGVQHTFLLAEHVCKAGLSGTFVECGVASGALAAAMGYALIKHKQQYRGLHLFDSFEGIPLAGPKDHDQPGIGHYIADVNLPIEERLKSSGVSIGTETAVRQNMAHWHIDNSVSVTYHKGWFQHTLPAQAVTLPDIAMLRLDGDLYESTQCCLKHLYSRVVPGGLILLDDYPLSGSRTAFEEFFAGNLPEVSVQVDTGAGFWFKPQA